MRRVRFVTAGGATTSRVLMATVNGKRAVSFFVFF